MGNRGSPSPPNAAMRRFVGDTFALLILSILRPHPFATSCHSAFLQPHSERTSDPRPFHIPWSTYRRLNLIADETCGRTWVRRTRLANFFRWTEGVPWTRFSLHVLLRLRSLCLSLSHLSCPIPFSLMFWHESTLRSAHDPTHTTFSLPSSSVHFYDTILDERTIHDLYYL
ncbi:hypothetical protein FA13DRAFT_389442 [Coprinellus micaceus]|uniref:Uncharacterized protein n=1 Tax=Coprinellus micaceus TaxID=71717 RepID=A0A4Y7TWW1_COPMI|nr:hypothetical protein FA13DRAFT_389442 [Coprinellus micaceus]